MITIQTATALSDGALMSAATRLAAEGRQVTADLIALLAVLVERKLYAAEGYGTAHDFCVGRLLLSDAQAYHRLAAAHVAWRFPAVLAGLRDGRLTLTTVALLRPHLTEENASRVLAWAEGRGKREVEVFVRSLVPLPDVAPSIRRLAGPRVATPVAADQRAAAPAAARLEAGAPRPGGEPRATAVPPAAAVEGALFPASADEPPSAPTASWPRAADVRPSTEAGRPPLAPAALPPRRAEIHPLTPTRYSVRLTISEATHAKLRRAADLLGHAVPTGDLAEVLDRALTLLVEHLERSKYAATSRKPTPAAAAARPRPRRSPRPHPPSSPAAAPPAAPVGVAAPSPSASTRRERERAGTRPTSSRYIPAAVRREVYERDGGCCTYVGPAGRCRQTRRLEFHHRQPFAEGGPATASNLALACTVHNRLEAARWFGEDFDRSKPPARPTGNQTGG